MSIFYALDGSRATFQEYFWGSKNPIQLLAAAIIKTFRLKPPFSSDDATVHATRECVVGALPPDLESKFAPLAGEIQALGFCDPVFHVIEDHNTQTKIVWATFRHHSGLHCARIHYRWWGKTQKTERALFPMFITSFPNGTFLVSSSGKPDVAAPASVRMNRMIKAPIQMLWATHEPMATEMSAGEGCLAVTNREEVIEITERLHETLRDFHLARGFFRPLTTKESKEAADTAMRVEQARATGQQYPEVMAELGKLQDAKASWQSALWLLVISVAVFIGSGGKEWSWKVTGILVPILFFHEAGHWLAMRVFGYRNLRMFFIPLFGAAVTGKHWNVAGWKKALVSLAGPLPGIALGAGLTAVALITGNANIRFAALMLIILNAINLVPILPLDGGQFMQATLFCRNRWLDLVFKLAAIGGLIAASVTGVAPYMRYVAIALAVGLPVTFKLAKVADQFRANPTPPMLPGEDRISPEAAAPMIEAVKAAMPKMANTKTVAQSVLTVFETLNSRPPGILATIGLMVLYVSGLIASALCVIVLVVANHGSLRDFIARAARQPQHSLTCNSFHVTKAAGVPVHLNGARDLVIGTFKQTAQANKFYTDSSANVPERAILLQFGDSVLLSLPSHDPARNQWCDEFEAATTNTFVVSSNNSVALAFMFIAPNSTVASNLEAELNDYYSSAGSTQLAPPWDDTANASELARRKSLRHAWHEMEIQLQTVWTNSSLKPIDKQIAAASRRGDDDKVAELQKTRAKEVQRLEASALESLKTKYGTGEYAELLSLNAQLQNISYTNQAARRAVLNNIAAHLGAASENSAPGASTYVTRAGLLLHLPYATIRDPQYSLPALMRWLCEQNCTSFKYDMRVITFDPDMD